MNRLDPRAISALIGALLMVVTLAVYWPASTFDFTNFDDPEYVTKNSVVQGGLTRAGIQWAFTSTSSAMWHPVTWLAHLTVWEVFGPASGGHHVVNIAIHALNACLVFLLFNLMTGAVWRSAFIAALFAWHPLRVESVAWVAELKDVLALFFWLVAVGCHARFARSGRGVDRWLLLVVYVLGLMTKPMLVTLPFALLLIDIWPLRRLSVSWGHEAIPHDPSARCFGPVTWRQGIVEKLPLMGLALMFSILTFLTSKGGTAVTELPILHRIGNAFVSYVRYLGKSFYPVDLAVLYPHPGRWPLWSVALSVLLVAGLSMLALLMARRRPYVFAGWFWFVGTLVPVIGLVQAGPQAMADRFSYVPSIGLVAMLVWGVAGLARHLPFGHWGVAGFGLVVAGACLAGTTAQLGHWRNSITLFERALAVTSNNPIAHYNLGHALSVAGQIQDAVSHYEKAIRMDPKYDAAWNNLGLCYSILGQPDKAAEHFREALRIQPNNWDAHYNYGQALAVRGQLEEAAEHLATTSRLAPRHPRAQLDLGRVRAHQGRAADAYGHFARSLEINPRCFESHYELAVLRFKQGATEEAIAHLRTAVQLKPDYAEAYARLGLALAGQRRAVDAIAQYRQALTYSPNAIEPLNNLAWLLATDASAAVRDGTEAVRLATHACLVTSNQVPYLIGTLAAAYAEAARFDEAARAAQQAAELATRLGLTNVAAKNQELEQLFRLRKPYRIP